MKLRLKLCVDIQFQYLLMLILGQYLGFLTEIHLKDNIKDTEVSSTMHKYLCVCIVSWE